MKYFLIIVSFLVLSTIQANHKNFIRIHSFVKADYTCSEHHEGQFKHVGDALGKDCVVNGWHKENERFFMTTYVNDGYKNDDWFGWRQEVLAPCDCKVVKVFINDIVNEPGIMTPGRATSITYKRTDDTYIVQAHLRELQVEKGDVVKAGQVVGRIGNNGFSRVPHVHIAAWKDDIPLQVIFDQSTIKSEDIN